MTDQPTIPLTDQQLAEYEALAQAATPGPWTAWAETYPHLVLQGPQGVDPSEAEGVISTNLAVNEAADAAFIAAMSPEVAKALLAEVHHLRAQLERRTEDLAFLERNTLPELRREVEHHQAGKHRWRDRAEKAEARVAELERPAIEAQRGEIQLSMRQLAAQAREDGDYEGEATVLQRLADRQAQWKAEDAAALPVVESHVVADDSSDPEHIDDCPGCEPAPAAVTETGE